MVFRIWQHFLFDFHRLLRTWGWQVVGAISHELVFLNDWRIRKLERKSRNK